MNPRPGKVLWSMAFSVCFLSFLDFLKQFQLSQGLKSRSDVIYQNTQQQQQQQQQQQTADAASTQMASSSVHVPLHEYVPPKRPIQCPNGLTPVEMVINPIADNATDRKIPRIVHMTGKTTCLTKPFLRGTEAWKFPNHSFYFHDDDAVHDLIFQREWPLFPQLPNAMQCISNAGGAALADIWRYLVMWEYGGIYTDMDNLPGQLFNGSTVEMVLGPDTDALFLQERGGFPSQYFFAVSPKHPIMFFALQDVMRELHGLLDTGNFYVPSVTGPGVIKRAFIMFMGKSKNATPKPSQGVYKGYYTPDRTVRIAGRRLTCDQWVVRSALGGQAKNSAWRQMNVTEYQSQNKEPSYKSCLIEMYQHHTNASISINNE